MKQLTHFEKFLINRGLLEVFKTNYQKQNTHTEYEKFQKLFGYKRDAIDLAFNWFMSLEGKSFWYKIDHDWKKSLKNKTL